MDRGGEAHCIPEVLKKNVWYNIIFITIRTTTMEILLGAAIPSLPTFSNGKGRSTETPCSLPPLRGRSHCCFHSPVPLPKERLRRISPLSPESCIAALLMLWAPPDENASISSSTGVGPPSCAFQRFHVPAAPRNHSCPLSAASKCKCSIGL